MKQYWLGRKPGSARRVKEAAVERDRGSDLMAAGLLLLAAAAFARELLDPQARDAPRRAPKGRGRDARSPAAIPAPGWRDILLRTLKEASEDDIVSVARSIAFSSVLAVFPALAAFVSVYGLFADVDAARDHLAALTGILPAEALTLLGEQMARLAAAQDAGLSVTLLAGVALSVWSANSGMKALFKGLNVAYEEEETRSFLRLNLITLAFTISVFLFLAIGAGALVVTPFLLDALGLHDRAMVVSLVRWPLLLALTTLLMAALYRFGPSRQQARWRWVSPGSLVATLLWLGGSGAFTWYLANFAHYDATYGALGAVFGFMVWLWLSATIVLLGAEFNSEIEHQTAIDSTTGPPRPMGSRGAAMADTLGASPGGLRASFTKAKTAA